MNFIENVSTLRKITLEDNPWLCNCNTLNFLNLIQDKLSSNPELHKVKCNGYNKSISEMTPEQFCPHAGTNIR